MVQFSSSAQRNAFRRRGVRLRSRFFARENQSLRRSPQSDTKLWYVASLQFDSVLTENGRRFLLLLEAVGVLIRYLR
jgi:hypothetical protein